ncbi:MAG: chromosome segregation protein [Lentisphaerae bacterium ADurb.Bin082]|nr:MAG: chromosome segregation protein [Lentisphaerae bacterium ADurb.Bin082]
MAEERKITSGRLLGMNIVGGFLNGTSYDFTEGLNCIIGARGTGKTSCLEFIRYCLDVMPPEPKARERLSRLVAANLRGGHIDVKVRTREGLEYIISRSVETSLTGDLLDTRPVVKSLDGNATGIPFSDAFCRLDMFSQNEIEEIAMDRRAQLRLIDSFKRDDLQEIDAELSRVKASVNAINAAIVPLRQEMSTLEPSQDRLPEVERRLADLSGGDGVNADIQNAQAQRGMRTVESQMHRRLSDALRLFPGMLQHASKTFGEALLRFNGEELEDSDNADLVEQMTAVFNRCQEDAEDAFQQLGEHLSQATSQMEEIGRELSLRHDNGEVAYQEALELDRQCRERAEERMELLNERQSLMESRRRLLELRVQVEEKQNEGRKLSARLSSLYDRRSDIRRKIVRDINGRLCPGIRVTMNQFADRSEFFGALCDALRGLPQGRHLASLVSNACSPAALADAVRNGDRSTIASAIGREADDHQTAAVLGALRDENALARLEAAELQDMVQIELRVGRSYRPSSELSTGQKCNAVLPILLMDGDRPLLIDQPEDNLDNGYVHEIIVKSVLDVKGRRQLVFVTHNPNIPVLGGAEGMLVLRAEDGQARDCAHGSFMDCREHIIKLLEGGREAFERRRDCYK